MTYWNPVLAYGADRFAADLAAAGGTGLITPDLIPDEAGEWLAASDAHDLDRIFLVAPSSTPSGSPRPPRPAAAGSTPPRRWASPARATATSSVGACAGRARPRGRPTLPVGVGLGVSTGAQAAEVAAYADGVIVGSALVRCLLDADGRGGGRRRRRRADRGARRRGPNRAASAP